MIADGPGWEGLGDLVAKAAALASTAASDPLNHVLGGLQPFPPLHAANAAHAGHRGVARGRALADAVGVLRSDGTARPTGFLRPSSRWSRLLRTQSDHRFWETAVLFHLRDRVPTTFVRKYTLRPRPESSGAHEAVEGGPGHARELGDGGLQDAQIEEAPDLVLLAVEP